MSILLLQCDPSIALKNLSTCVLHWQYSQNVLKYICAEGVYLSFQLSRMQVTLNILYQVKVSEFVLIVVDELCLGFSFSGNNT